MNENTLNLDEYGQLLLKLKSYLRKDDVEFTDEIISAYDLHQLVQKRLKALRDIKQDITLRDKINKKPKNIFRKLEPKDRCTGTCYSYDSTASTICLTFEKAYNNGMYNIYVNKDRNSDEIYFGTRVDKKLVEDNYDYIMGVFDILEDGYKLFKEEISDHVSARSTAKFTDGFLDVNILCTDDGTAKISATLRKEADPNGIYTREWFKRQKLSDYFQENATIILKKIPVEIESLESVFKKIVIEELSKEKGPVLMKK